MNPLDLGLAQQLLMASENSLVQHEQPLPPEAAPYEMSFLPVEAMMSQAPQMSLGMGGVPPGMGGVSGNSIPDVQQPLGQQNDISALINAYLTQKARSRDDATGAAQAQIMAANKGMF